MKISKYLVLGRRWGDPDGHTYVVGLYSEKQAALDARILEIDHRGGKYDCDVIEIQDQDSWSNDSNKNGIKYVVDCSRTRPKTRVTLSDSDFERLKIIALEH